MRVEIKEVAKRVESILFKHITKAERSEEISHELVFI